MKPCINMPCGNGRTESHSTVVNVPTKVPPRHEILFIFFLKQNGLAMLVNQRWNPFIVYGWNIWMDFLF